ncbi:MAG: hypothetical protein ABEI53_01030 [Candidatus Magasanikbacteria bacterium]
MTKETVQKKIMDLENDLNAIKKAVQDKPDFSIDEKNWKKVEKKTKEIRSRLYSERYGK